MNRGLRRAAVAYLKARYSLSLGSECTSSTATNEASIPSARKASDDSTVYRLLLLRCITAFRDSTISTCFRSAGCDFIIAIISRAIIPACILSAAAEKHCAPASPSARSMYADKAETRKLLPFFLLIQIDEFRNLRVPSLLYQPNSGAITSSRCHGSRVIDWPALSPFVKRQNVSMKVQTRSTFSCFQI